jgi:hypothetical protein
VVVKETLPLSIFNRLARVEVYQDTLDRLAEIHIFADWFLRGVKDAQQCLEKLKSGHIWTGRDTYADGGLVAIGKQDFEELKLALQHPRFDEPMEEKKKKKTSIKLDFDI